MSELRVVVVEDEPIARRGLVQRVEEHEGFVVARECANGAEAIEALRAEAFDLVLLDVEMPEVDGFGVLEALADADLPPVVFVTAYDTYAVRAFDAHALDYLLKPVDPERLGRALARARQRIETGEQAAKLDALRRELANETAAPERIAARCGGRTVLVPVEDIDWLEAADNYVRLVAAGRVVLQRETLTSLVGRLAPRFVRIHRSIAVNLARVREIRALRSGDGRVHLVDGTELSVSRRYRDALEAAIR